MINLINNLSTQYCLNNFNTHSKVGFRSYCYDYSGNKNPNGKAPDKKIIDVITRRFPYPKNITIVDIGAGDGRNSIPLLEKGYKIIALEQKELGREKIKSKIPQDKKKRIQVVDKDIVKTALMKKSNAFIMPHVSQHLTLDKLEKTFAHVSKSLKNRGIFMFDALVDFSGKPFVNTKEDDSGGYCRFTEAQIKDTARKNGFNFIEKAPYNETGDSRPDYIDQRRWGGEGMDAEDKKNEKRPVKLEWFVFEKA